MELHFTDWVAIGFVVFCLVLMLDAALFGITGWSVIGWIEKLFNF